MLFHGINSREVATSVSTPHVAESGLPFAVGAAPIWHGTQGANVPALITNWAEAKTKFGYSDDWENYPLCEALFTHFVLYGMSPMFAVCPLDPATMKTAETARDVTVTGHKCYLDLETIASSIVVKSPAAALAEAEYPITDGTAVVNGLNLTVTGVVVKTTTGTSCTEATDYTLALENDMLTLTVVAGGALAAATACKITVPRASTAITYEEGEDYEVYVDGENVIVEALSDGPLYGLYVTSLSVADDKATPASVTADTIIGGYDVNTHSNKGLETIEECMPRYGMVPDIIICPGWSQDSAVAAVMKTKAGSINGLFGAIAYIDTDCTAATGADSYDEVYAWKQSKNINGKDQVLYWPMGKLGTRKFHASTQLASLTAQSDMNYGGCPVRSPSNLNLQLDTICDGAGNEVLITLQQADLLNAKGIGTMSNFMGGLRAWGDWTACYPTNTDPKDYLISTNRMFKWVSKTVVYSIWDKIDRPFNMILLQSIQNSINDWLNGLTGRGDLLGGRVEFREEENPTAQLMAGHVVFHVYIYPPAPMARADFLYELDVSYLSALFAS